MAFSVGGPARPAWPTPRPVGVPARPVGVGSWPSSPSPVIPNRGPEPMPQGPMNGRIMGTFHKGGKVKKTGNYRLKKGEAVVPLKSMRNL